MRVVIGGRAGARRSSERVSSDQNPRCPRRDPCSGKLKTQPEYLSVFLRDAAEARTEEELHRGLRRSFQQLAATGSFKDVRVAILPPAADAPPSSVREGDVHLVLSEGSYGLQAGASINMAGQAEGFYEGRLINVLGQMDSVSVRVSHAQSQLADVSSASSLLRPEGTDGGAEELLRSKVNLAREELSHPTVELRFSKPTLGGHPVSLDVYGRAHTASLQSRSAMSVYTQEAGVSSRFAEGTQSVSYFLGRRSVIPARSTTSPFEVVSSPQCVRKEAGMILPDCVGCQPSGGIESGAGAGHRRAIHFDSSLRPSRSSLFFPSSSLFSFPSWAVLRIATESDSSIVSGLRYSVTKDERSTPVLPASGYLATGSVELAGLGGDVAHLKTEARAQANLSLNRYAPDTGYDLPMARGEHASTRATMLKGVPPPPSGLRPHPGLRGWGPRSLLGRLLGVDATNEAALARDRDSYLFADRVAGWLSPGLVRSVHQTGEEAEDGDGDRGEWGWSGDSLEENPAVAKVRFTAESCAVRTTDPLRSFASLRH